MIDTDTDEKVGAVDPNAPGNVELLEGVGINVGAIDS